MKLDYLLKIGKSAAIAKLAEHEQKGTLLEFISEIAPEYIDCGNAMKFTLLSDLGWL